MHYSPCRCGGRPACRRGSHRAALSGAVVDPAPAQGLAGRCPDPDVLRRLLGGGRKARRQAAADRGNGGQCRGGLYAGRRQPLPHARAVAPAGGDGPSLRVGLGQHFLIYDARRADPEALQAAGAYYVSRLGRLPAAATKDPLRAGRFGLNRKGFKGGDWRCRRSLTSVELRPRHRSAAALPGGAEGDRGAAGRSRAGRTKPPVPVHAVSSSSRSPTPKVRAFIDHARKTFSAALASV